MAFSPGLQHTWGFSISNHSLPLQFPSFLHHPLSWEIYQHQPVLLLLPSPLPFSCRCCSKASNQNCRWLSGCTLPRVPPCYKQHGSISSVNIETGQLRTVVYKYHPGGTDWELTSGRSCRLISLLSQLGTHEHMDVVFQTKEGIQLPHLTSVKRKTDGPAVAVSNTYMSSKNSVCLSRNRRQRALAGSVPAVVHLDPVLPFASVTSAVLDSAV